MGAYVVRRLAWIVVVILLITLLTFLIFYVMPPGDPAVRFAGRQPTPEIVAQVRHLFGLDQPLWKQYGTFVWRLFAGDEYGWPGLGFSFDSRSPVRDQLFDRAAVTMQLAGGAALIWLVVGIPIGVISAIKRRSVFDRTAMGFTLLAVSIPSFALGLMGLLIFWQKLHVNPGTGYVAFGEDAGQWFSHMWLPWIVLATQYAAIYARLVRGSLLDSMGEDYIRTARAKGMTERRVVTKHGLRASLTPVVTQFGLDFSILIGGAVLTENVFNLPGLGQLIVGSAIRSDIPVVLATTVVAAFFVAVMSLVVDIIYAYLDPRVRYT